MTTRRCINSYKLRFNVSSSRVKWGERVPAKLSTAEILSRLELGTSGCWLYKTVLQPNGYSVIGRTYGHRYFYEMFNGPIPSGYQIDHTCKVRCCVNPEHLEAVTHQENLKRSAPSILCKNKIHERTPESTFIDYKGHIKCRFCIVNRLIRKKAGNVVPTANPK